MAEAKTNYCSVCDEQMQGTRDLLKMLTCSKACAQTYYQAKDRAAGVAVLAMKLEEIREIFDYYLTQR